jgi:hypothetical protein
MFLMNLLPGLRDLRAPLAAGYLWLTAAWLYFAPQLPASVDEAGGVLKDIYRVLEAAGPVAVAAGLSFAAYIIGILSTGLLTAPTRSIFLLPNVPLLMVYFPASWVDRYILRRRRRYRRIPRRSWFIEMMIRLEGVLASWRDKFPITRSPRIRLQDLVIRRISNKILTDPEFRSIFFDRLQKALEEDTKPTGALLNHRFYEFSQLQFRYGYLMKDGYLLIEEGSSIDVKASQRILRVLGEGADKGLLPRDVAEIVIETAVDVYRHVDEIAGELPLIPERLVGDKPATYERWDRLSSESEFRQAIVPPLGAIIAALLLRGAIDWPFAILCLVAILVILAQGIGKGNEAVSQLIQLLEAGVITIPPINRLTTTDLYWLSSDLTGKPDGQVSLEISPKDKTLAAEQGKPKYEAVDDQIGIAKPIE